MYLFRLNIWMHLNCINLCSNWWIWTQGKISHKLYILIFLNNLWPSALKSARNLQVFDITEADLQNYTDSS